VDRLLRQLDIAAFRAIAWHPEGPLEEAAGGDRRRLILGEVRRHPALFSRIQEPVMDMASLAIPWEAIDSKESAAWTNDVTLQLSPLVYKKVVLEADDAVSDALAAIQEKARAALQDVEKVAKGMLLTALDSARNEIVRE